MAAVPETVAFLGLGTMGRGMASSALRAGIPTVVWNRKPGPADQLRNVGAEVAGSAAEAARQSSVLVTKVTDADAVVSIANDQGALAALPAGAIWVQMSTIGVAGTERVAAVVERLRPDVVLIDAPVSGSKEPAEQGRLTIFASGPDHARDRVAPLFDALGQRTIWMGPVGAGSRMKLVNNTLLAFTAEGLGTSVALARRLGLDVDRVVGALEGGPLLSPWETAKLDRIRRQEFSAEFALVLALKDVHLALETVDPERFEAYAALAHEWETAVGRGLGGDDVTVVARALEDEADAP